MIFEETRLKGGFIVEMKRIEDDRGFFARGWCPQEFREHGLNPHVAQFNVAFNPRQGTLRGMHFQRAPHAEAKFVRCTRGALYDVMIDLRPDSPTHGQWVGEELTADNHRGLYIPEGFAHGYQTLTPDCEMYYFTTHTFARESAAGVRFDDPAFGIEWPEPVTLISEADRKWPDYEPVA